MNRGLFLKELGGSLFQTVKSVYAPFLKDDLVKIEEAADRALGITWYPLMKKLELNNELEMKFIAGKPVIVSHYGTNMRAMDGVCPVCSNIIILTTLYSSGKCLNCQKEFDFNTWTGELELESYPLKLVNDLYYIGYQSKKGENHA